MWVGGVTAAKGTRKTHDIAGAGKKQYTPEERRLTSKQQITMQRKMKYFTQVLRLPLFFN
jgi:hypothetical protein